jgi:hypothetical protein
MPLRRPSFFTSARGRLLFFNLLVVAVTLMVSAAAVLGFRHASRIQEQVQQQTFMDVTSSMNLARDTANVATAAVRLSQVVGALEYKGEAERLQATQTALKHSLEHLWQAMSRSWCSVLFSAAMNFSKAWRACYSAVSSAISSATPC